MQLRTAQTIAIMVAIVVIMLRVFSFIYCFVFVFAKLSLFAVISKHTCPGASSSGLFRVATHPEGICEEFARIYEELRGIYSFSFLAEHFSERFSPKSLHVSILLSTFAIARIYMWSTPHKQRARIYVQAQPTLYNRCGLIFCP